MTEQKAETDALVVAAALEQVAQEWSDRWVQDGRHHGTPGAYSDGYERDLRRRAAAIRRAHRAAAEARALALRRALGDEPAALSFAEFVKRVNSVYPPGGSS